MALLARLGRVSPHHAPPHHYHAIHCVRIASRKSLITSYKRGLLTNTTPTAVKLTPRTLQWCTPRGTTRRFASQADDEELDEEGEEGAEMGDSQQDMTDEEYNRLIRKFVDRQFAQPPVDTSIHYPTSLMTGTLLQDLHQGVAEREWDLFKWGFEKAVIEKYHPIYQERASRHQEARKELNRALRRMNSKMRQAMRADREKAYLVRREIVQALEDPEGGLWTRLPGQDELFMWGEENVKKFTDKALDERVTPFFKERWEENIESVHTFPTREIQMMHIGNPDDFLVEVRSQMLEYGFPVRPLREVSDAHFEDREVVPRPHVSPENPFVIITRYVGRQGERLRYRTVKVRVNVAAMGLSPRARERLLKMVGKRYRPEWDAICYSVRRFNYQILNKRYARRLFQKLWEEALKADESWIPLEGSPCPPTHELELVDKPNRHFTIFRCSLDALSLDLKDWAEEAATELS